MRQLDLSNYMVGVRNEQGVGKFKEQSCKCGLDLTAAQPTNLRVLSLADMRGSCPQCEEPHAVEVPPFLEVPYDVKDSIVEMLLSREFQMSGRQLLEHQKVADKIVAQDGQILLEEADWAKLVKAAETVKGLGRHDVELCRRIFDAPQVEVEEKK